MNWCLIGWCNDVNSLILYTQRETLERSFNTNPKQMGFGEHNDKQFYPLCCHTLTHYLLADVCIEAWKLQIVQCTDKRTLGALQWLLTPLSLSLLSLSNIERAVHTIFSIFPFRCGTNEANVCLCRSCDGNEVNRSCTQLYLVEYKLI